MLLAVRCGCCGRRGASPCVACWTALRPPAPEPPPPGLADLVVLLRYEGPARPLVARVKYRGARQAVRWLGAALADRVRVEVGDPIGVVTWAPTTRAHRRGRGFDHAELLARAVARSLGVGVAPLLRRGPGPPQTGRSAAARRAQPPSFSVPSRTGPVGPDRRGTVLLIDDVVTTGATLRAAASALRDAGLVVVPAALARTPSPGAAG